MKKNILVILAVILILSCTAVALADVNTPTLTLQVSVSHLIIPNVTYRATLTGWSSATTVPVITFFCNNVEVGKATVDSTGVAILRLTQTSGQYQAFSAWLNTPVDVKSNVVKYTVL